MAERKIQNVFENISKTSRNDILTGQVDDIRIFLHI